jgi:hypothetical protein
MDHIGIDVHKTESQLCILGEDGQLSERRIRTTTERFAAVLGDRPRARILLEASTESEWVARCLEGLGHEVIVADPNFAPMYAARSRKIKTDRRDARALAVRDSPWRVGENGAARNDSSTPRQSFPSRSTRPTSRAPGRQGFRRWSRCSAVRCCPRARSCVSSIGAGNAHRPARARAVLDSRGANGVAVEGTIEAPRESWRRPKWATVGKQP